MRLNDFPPQFKEKFKEIDNLITRIMPRVAGKIAVDHFNDNFTKGGFVNNGLHPWKVTRRQLSGSDRAEAQYGPLLSARNHLASETVFVPGDARVVIRNAVPYAAIHNNGGTVNPTVTPKMRKFAWAKYYSEKGKNKTPSAEALRWKGLALTKKTKLSIHIPQRQFIGHSEELNKSIRDSFERRLINIFK